MSHLEEEYLFQIRAAGLPLPRAQYRIDPERRFKWDYAWPEMLLAVEINGGTTQKPIKIGNRWYIPVSGHNSMSGTARDAEKINIATIRGYHTLVFTAEMIRDGRALAWTQEFFRRFTPF